MSATDTHNHGDYSANSGAYLAVRDFLAGVSDSDGLEGAVEEGRQIAAILEPFGLPEEILAAVHIYPLYRAKILSTKSLQNKELKDISRFVISLEQLNQFSLPAHWVPGESLAAQQSEALRKMLLSVAPGKIRRP